MKSKNKLLIIASACLVALSLAACAGNDTPAEQDSSAGGTSPAPQQTTTPTPEAKDETTETEDGNRRPVEETRETEATVAPQEKPTEEILGPQLPQEEITLPPFEGMETNIDGGIELPFIPFPQD